MGRINNRITYNNYEVMSVRVINITIFVKTFDKETGEVIWFIGFKTKSDLITDIKRILLEEHKYANEYFKSMFKEDYYTPKIKLYNMKKEK